MSVDRQAVPVPLTAPGLPDLPAELAGPVGVALAKPVRGIPRPDALPGGCRYEPKWDGYRMVVVRGARSTRLWSKQGRDLTDRSQDVATDVLAAGGQDLRGERWRDRRALLEALAARWAPPLQLSPVTADLAEAEQWFEDYRPAGIEGLVAKGATTPYRPGRREWLKVKSWETTEVVAGGVIGTLERPSQLVAGGYRDGELVVVGRTSPLSPRQSEELAAVLTRADADHPWPDHIGTGRFGGGRLSVPLTRVRPELVVEVSADAALQAGVFRHPLRYVRLRPDLRPEDVPPVA